MYPSAMDCASTVPFVQLFGSNFSLAQLCRSQTELQHSSLHRHRRPVPSSPVSVSADCRNVRMSVQRPPGSFQPLQAFTCGEKRLFSSLVFSCTQDHSSKCWDGWDHLAVLSHFDDVTDRHGLCVFSVAS